MAREVGLHIDLLGVGEAEVRTDHVHFTPVVSAADSELTYARALKRSLERERVVLPPDTVVLANAEHYVWALRGTSVPIVLVAHGVVSETLRGRRGPLYTWFFRHLIEARAVKRVARIVVVNERVRRYYATRYPRSAAGKVVSIPVGVLLGDFIQRPRAVVVGEPPLDAGARVVLFVGRLSPEKNVELFVQSCDALDRSGDRFTAMIIGDGPQAPRVVELRKTRPWLRWIPALSHDQVLDLMAVARVLAICSSYEGLPTVLLEAIASGLPVVSTDVGRSRELLRPPVGRVVEASPAAFADALRVTLSEDRTVVRDASQSLLKDIDFMMTARMLANVLREVRGRRASGISPGSLPSRR